MDRTLNKRILRDLRKNIGRYLAVTLMITLGVYLVVSIVGSADMVIVGTENAKEKNQVEDGQFSAFLPLTEREIEGLEARRTVIEEHFSFDVSVADGVELRVFQTRKEVDLIMLEEGRLAQASGEAVLEKNYARAHGLRTGEVINVLGHSLKIVGTGSVPDYDAALKTFSSPAADAHAFGLLFVSKEQYEEFRELSGKTEEYVYAYRLGEETADELKERIKALDFDYEKVGIPCNLTSFVKAEDNLRIAAAAGDVIMDKRTGLAAGVIVLILFAYVLSVFIVRQIEGEQSVIGALYSLGVTKGALLRHYVLLPTLLALLAGMLGSALAFSPWGIGVMAQNTYDYFSIPTFEMTYPVYLVIYGVGMAPLICLIVNVITINGKLSRTALSLLRNEQTGNSRKQFQLKIKSFTLLFAVRQLLREARSAVIVVLGMLITLMVVMLGINTYVLCMSVRDHNIEDTKYAYAYALKYPEKNVPAGGEGVYQESLSIDCMGYQLDVSVIGLDGKSRFFDAKPEKGKSKAVVNRSLVQRFGFAVGDKITLEDRTTDQNYSFTITGISEYSVGFVIFMDAASMRELFGEEEGYYNVVYSGEELPIEEGRIYSVTTKEDIENSSSVFLDTMMTLVITLISAGIIIFCVVMYLMMAVMIDRSTMGISLIKIFGYRSDEVRKLYLNGNTAVVAVGGLITIPIAKFLIDKLYPSFIPNVACSMFLEYSWQLYLELYLGLMLVYFVVNALLLHKINRITPVEILKDRE